VHHSFQTIKDALATTYTARNMRIVFLMGRWHDGVETGPEMRKQADNWESTVDVSSTKPRTTDANANEPQNFFTNIKSRLAEAYSSTNGVQSLSLKDDKSAGGLREELEQAKKDLDSALNNSFDTPTAMLVVLRLVRDANIYMNDKSHTDLSAVEAVARWVTRIVGIFGLDANAEPPYDGLGWASASATTYSNPREAVRPYADALAKVRDEVKSLQLLQPSVDELLQQNPDKDFESLLQASEKDLERLSLPYVRAISRLRDELRTSAPSLPQDSKKAVLALSDRIRDYDLASLGVQLDDQTDKPSLIKFVPAERLIAARNEKEALAAGKAKQKEEARLAREKAEQEKWEKAKIKPQEMFRGETDKYSEWDADGLPTKVKDGGDVPKSQAKKLKKDWDRQKKLHDEWQLKFGGS
jgi:cysteinyl-tRNA synthetase